MIFFIGFGFVGYSSAGIVTDTGRRLLLGGNPLTLGGRFLTLE